MVQVTILTVLAAFAFTGVDAGLHNPLECLIEAFCPHTEDPAHPPIQTTKASAAAAAVRDVWSLKASTPEYTETAPPPEKDLDPECYNVKNPGFENATLSPWKVSDPRSIKVQTSRGRYQAQSGRKFLRFTVNDPKVELSISQQLHGLEPGNHWINWADTWTEKNNTGASECTIKIKLDDEVILEDHHWVLDPFYWGGGSFIKKIASPNPVLSFNFLCPDAPSGGVEFLMDDITVYPIGTNCNGEEVSDL
ncbi:hypothetical protein BHE90_007672 [Fusarium euwallaceae]|uniref:GH16 domain-containing protein n=1 Tax=Fusarium euwallaceae TaxID=1147111 RepID=A0A430LQ62_9HYPO|nr:hypothetical protein BHE90_007672 [Fusarium euwallaceae]